MPGTWHLFVTSIVPVLSINWGIRVRPPVWLTLAKKVNAKVSCSVIPPEKMESVREWRRCLR